MTMEVGIAFAVVAPVGVNERLFVRLIVKLVAVPAAAAGTVITTGDHVPTAPAVAGAAVVTDAGFKAAQVAVEPVARAPQL
jgi:hypothetical protein